MHYAEIARAETPRGELVLTERRDADRPPVLELRSNGVFVMDTAETSTERALAAAALAEVADPQRVLIGGLGLGFTLHQVLADPRVQRCTVVEIEADLVGWMRDGTIEHGPALLADPRGSVLVADIAETLSQTPEASFDLVLLDVDNGPGQLVHQSNAALYLPSSLAGTARVLRPGGALVVWSAHRSPELLRALRAAFGQAKEIAHQVRLQQRDEHYYLYLARRTAA